MSAFSTGLFVSIDVFLCLLTNWPHKHFNADLLADIFVPPICTHAPVSVWPHLFRVAGHEKRRDEMVRGIWFVHWKFSMCTATRLDRVCFCVFSLGLYFVYSFVFLCVSPILLCFPEQLSHLPYSFGVSVTNLNEPPRALATSTIAWVRSQLHPFWALVNKNNAG